MKKNNIPKARKEGLVIQELDGETLIYDLDTNRAVCLNQTSAIVWQNCDGTRNVSEIGTFLAKELNNPVNEDLIWLALDQLKKENLIENPKELETGFEGVSRREAVRKIGVASLIALPIIAAVTVPTAAQTASACAAATNRPSGCSCTADTQCVGGTLCRNAGCNATGSRTCRTGCV